MKEGGKATSYQYDLLNRQTSVQMPDGRVQENLYDGEELRAGIRECGKLSTFLYYNGEILAECNGESMPLRRRLPGMSSLQNLEDGQYHACHQDEKGSTIYITGRDGAVENCYVYDAFGNTLKKKEGIQNRIQYTGQQYDQEAGQYYLRARYYNPTVGRFTQEDTYRGDGLNLYAYCKNNPVLYYDLSGHDLVVNSSNGPETTNTSGVEKGNSSIDNKSGSGSGTLSNVDARKWYLEQEAKIPDLIDDSLPLEQQARQAFELRNQYRMQVRELMSDRQLAESLYVTDPNLTWEQIIQKQIDKGLSGDDIYKAIIESSQRSRTSINQSLDLE